MVHAVSHMNHGAISISEIANGYLVDMPEYIKAVKQPDIDPNFMGEMMTAYAQEFKNLEDRDPLIAKLQGKDLNEVDKKKLQETMLNANKPPVYEKAFGIRKVSNVFFFSTLPEVFKFIEEKLEEQKLNPPAPENGNFYG